MVELGAGWPCAGKLDCLVPDGWLVPDCRRPRVRAGRMARRREHSIIGCQWVHPLGVRVAAGRGEIANSGGGCGCAATVDGLLPDGWLVPDCGRRLARAGGTASRG